MTPPTTMRAMVTKGHGGFEMLQWEEAWPVPSPGPGDVIIKVGACGLNTTDINTRTAWYSKGVTEAVDGDAGFDGGGDEDGAWGGKLAFPRIQGADVAGRIVAVGDAVDPARIGERVLVDPWILGLGDWNTPASTGYFGSEADGGFCEYAIARSANTIALESDLSDAELAAFPCALHTAETLLLRVNPRPGETVVVAGASGGVGSMAVQLAKLRGARVVGIANPKKADQLLEMGCDAVADGYADDLAGAITEAANGPYECAVDVVGGRTIPAILSTLRHGGRYAASGAISGPMVELDWRLFYYRDLQLSGATITPPGTFARLARVIERGQLKPMLAKTFPLAELHDAQREFLKKAHVGNIVVTME